MSGQNGVQFTILAARIGGRNATEFLDGYLEQKNWAEDTLQIIPTALLVKIIEKHPQVIASASLWSRSDYVSILSKFVSMLRMDSELLVRSVKQMIQADAWDALSAVVDQIGTNALIQVLTTLDASRTKQLDYPNVAYSFLASRLHEISDLFSQDAAGARILKILSAEVDPRSWDVRKDDVRPWVGAAMLDVPFMDPRRELQSSVFFLSLGLSARDENGAYLVAASFKNVYDGAKSDRIETYLWERMESVLSWYSPSWDKCARLVRTVARAFKDRRSPIELFGKTFKTEEQFGRALSELDESFSGRRFIHELCQAHADGWLPLTAEQRKIADQVCLPLGRDF